MKIREFVIDLFCGAGGTSQGIHLSDTNSVVTACVNHDNKAIESHKLNHPRAKHFIEDIRNPEVVFFLKLRVGALRKLYPKCIITIWASLECTNFSIAKGGQPRDADSRTLANHLFMYLAGLNPDYLMIENVMEFMSWGDLDENGKPISKRKGLQFLGWVDKVKGYGYRFDWKELNSADFGAVTSRKRFFGQFAKGNMPISWPEQSHSKNPNQNNLFNINLKKWCPVKSVLDLEDHGQSIFNRKRPLSIKTMDVIQKGMVKAIKENQGVFIYKYYGNGDNYSSINNPSGTVTTKDRFAKVQLIFNQYKTGNTCSLEKPSGAVTTTPKQNLLTFIMNPSHGGHTTSIEKPSPVVIARQDKAPLYLISVLMQAYGIVDIKMRMLRLNELLKIQGFPEDYQLVGNQTQRKKFVGNSVEVTTAKVLFEAHYKGIENWFNKSEAA